MKAFVDFFILLMSSLSYFWNLLLTFLNFMLCTMSRRSASNLSSSLFCNEHFLEGHNCYISINTNLKICNFLDVTPNLSDGTSYPYRKPNNETLYIDSNSNHPHTIIKHLPAAIGRRISHFSSSKELFNQAKPHYESALKQGGHVKKLMFTERKKPATHTIQNSRKNRQRNIIWLNSPYSMNIQTIIGREFLNLVDKHFPKNHRYNKIFNKNNIKVSYSCRDNLQTIIKRHNREILETSKKPSTENNCNCRNKKNDSPLKKKTASPQASPTMPT